MTCLYAQSTERFLNNLHTLLTSLGKGTEPLERPILLHGGGLTSHAVVLQRVVLSSMVLEPFSAAANLSIHVALLRMHTAQYKRK